MTKVLSKIDKECSFLEDLVKVISKHYEIEELEILSLGTEILDKLEGKKLR